MEKNSKNKRFFRIRFLVSIFIFGLVLSGLTAIPLSQEVAILNRLLGTGSRLESLWPTMATWISLVHEGITVMYTRYPFLTYGNDWLAFGHFVIAIAFIGVLRNPMRNRWVVDFGIIACLLVIPYALIFGAIREIPIFWRLIDCSFGVIGLIPLLLARKEMGHLEIEGKNGIQT